MSHKESLAQKEENPNQNNIRVSSYVAVIYELNKYMNGCMIEVNKTKICGKVLKGTVSDKKYLQITLEIKKNAFQLQHVPFFSNQLHDFDRKTILYSMALQWT